MPANILLSHWGKFISICLTWITYKNNSLPVTCFIRWGILEFPYYLSVHCQYRYGNCLFFVLVWSSLHWFEWVWVSCTLQGFSCTQTSPTWLFVYILPAILQRSILLWSWAPDLHTETRSAPKMRLNSVNVNRGFPCSIHCTDVSYVMVWII